MRQPATAINSHKCDYDCDYIPRSAILVLPQTNKIAGGEIPGLEKKNRLRDETLRIQKFSDSKFPLLVLDSKSPEA